MLIGSATTTQNGKIELPRTSKLVPRPNPNVDHARVTLWL
jgi:hypothetical protein